MNSYEVGKNIAKNLKQGKEDPIKMEPWARLLVAGFWFYIAYFLCLIAADSDGYFWAWGIAALASAWYGYTFIEKEFNRLLGGLGVALKWAVYLAIALAAISLLFGAASANPIVSAIIFGAWMIAMAIRGK
jgi:hypothetical protein